MPEGMIRTIKTRWQQEAELAGRSERHNGIMRRVGWMDERQVRLSFPIKGVGSAHTCAR